MRIWTNTALGIAFLVVMAQDNTLSNVPCKKKLDGRFLGMFKWLTFTAPENYMELPSDMKNYRAEDYDSFRLMTAENAGLALLILVALVVIFEFSALA